MNVGHRETVSSPSQPALKYIILKYRQFSANHFQPIVEKSKKEGWLSKKLQEIPLSIFFFLIWMLPSFAQPHFWTCVWPEYHLLGIWMILYLYLNVAKSVNCFMLRNSTATLRIQFLFIYLQYLWINEQWTLYYVLIKRQYTKFLLSFRLFYGYNGKHNQKFSPFDIVNSCQNIQIRKIACFILIPQILILGYNIKRKN